MSAIIFGWEVWSRAEPSPADGASLIAAGIGIALVIALVLQR